MYQEGNKRSRPNTEDRCTTNKLYHSFYFIVVLVTSRYTYISYTREHASTRRLFRFIDPSRMITGQQVLVNFQVETKEGRGEVCVSSIEQNRPWSWVVLFRKLRDDEWPWKRRRDTSCGSNLASFTSLRAR